MYSYFCTLCPEDKFLEVELWTECALPKISIHFAKLPSHPKQADLNPCPKLLPEESMAMF